MADFKKFRMVLRGGLILAVLGTLLTVASAAKASALQAGVDAHVRALLQQETGFAMAVRRRETELKSYYLGQNGELLWIGTGRMQHLIALMRSAEDEGLFSSDYPSDHLEQLMQAVPKTDAKSRAVVELLFSGHFLKFASDLKAGRVLPRKVDPELYWQTKEIDLAAALATLGSVPDLKTFVKTWEPRLPAYKALKAELARYRKIAGNKSWPRIPAGEVLKPGMEDPRVPILRKRLSDAQHAEITESTLYDDALVERVKHFQQLHGLEPDGVIGFKTKVALNIPIEERVRQIVVSMERWRWLPEDLGEDYLLVNIASFYLTRFENGSFAERKKVIVGKPYRKTPAFSDSIKYLEFNPYWTVPYSIATRDKLPALQRNPSSLSGAGFEILAGSQQIDPAQVNWRQYSRSNFPFTLRQKPGPKNALGQVKFMFPNKFSVYLHDTPDRSLFDKTFRSFSSGCVRVHQPIDLAGQVLRGKQGWDRARIDAVLASGKRTVVNLDQPLPVHIVYSTAWVAEDGSIRFAVDFYNRDEKLYQALFGTPVPWRGG